VSCQTAPKTTDGFLEETQFVPLNSGASTYVFAEIMQMRSVIEQLPIPELNDRQVKQMLNRTSFMAVALFPQESGQGFQLTAWGNYPGNANTAFALNKGWKKQRSASKKTYWYSSANKTSIAMTSRQIFAASSLTDAPVDPFTVLPGMEFPEGFKSYSAGYPFLAWLENPGPMITKIINETGLPIRFPVQKIFIVLTPHQDKYTANINFQFENASQARGVMAILNIASSYFAADTGDPMSALFLANPPIQSGRNLNFTSAPIDEKELSLLLGSFFL